MQGELSTFARDLRIARASEQVAARYIITRQPDDGGFGIFKVEGGTLPYDVRVHPSWGADPSCTCPDATDGASRENRGYCKHIIAVLRRERALSYQLLELFL